MDEQVTTVKHNKYTLNWEKKLAKEVAWSSEALRMMGAVPKNSN